MKSINYKRQPNGYWTDETIIEELKLVISEIHDFPIHTYLRSINKTYLVTAITRNGGFNKYRRLLGYEYINHPSGFWSKEKVKYELNDIINNIGHFPTQKEILRLDKGFLVEAITKNGGLTKICMEMGYDPIQKNKYWTDETIVQELIKIQTVLGRFPTTNDLKSMDRQDIIGAIYKNGSMYKFRDLMGYKYTRNPNGYWAEETIINKLKEIMDATGCFPTMNDLRNTGKSVLLSAIMESGGMIKYRKLLDVPSEYFINYNAYMASYVVKRGKNTEKIIYDILCDYCKRSNIETPSKNKKLSKGNVIEFVCNAGKSIGIDVTNCECKSTVYRKWTKKEYYRHLDELWIVVVSDSFKKEDYIKWNNESPNNVYIYSIEDFCNELQYDLDESMRNKIDKYKQCTFHTRDKKDQ